MDKVHKPITTQYYIPSSKPFRKNALVVPMYHVTDNAICSLVKCLINYINITL
jgi:hypothetical protein